MGGAVTSFFGSGPATPPNLQTYQPQYTSQADTGAFTGIQAIQNNNPWLQNQGTYQSIEQQGLNNPYAAGVQSAANAAGSQYGTLGTQGAAAATGLNAGAMTLLPYVSQVENTAMDPQNALYNRTLQQVQDQANVANAQSGLTSSPFGASAVNNATSNFNIDWQNNQLARQQTGVNAAATGLAAAGNTANMAQTVGSTAAANTGLSGAAPNAAYISNLANMLNALNSYGTSQNNANATTQTAVTDFQNYMNEGAAQANQQATLNQQNYENQQNYINQENAQLANQVNSGINIGGNAIESGPLANASFMGIGLNAGGQAAGSSGQLPIAPSNSGGGSNWSGGSGDNASGTNGADNPAGTTNGADNPAGTTNGADNFSGSPTASDSMWAQFLSW